VKSDKTKNIQDQITEAYTQNTSLCITGGKSKTFYGNQIKGHTISTTEHTGIIEYQPSELVVTVRSGTKLFELEEELKANNQILAFEPPQHSESTTIGGVIACGLSGPRRVACGSARDFVLGTTIINGNAEICRFGGQVMKNVAGYDAARLMVGAQGTLGVILDVSLKVLPINETEISIKIQSDLDGAIRSLSRWIQQGLPITASCFLADTLYLRLGSTQSATNQALEVIRKTGDTKEIDDSFWISIKNQTHDFFKQQDLWRCSHQQSTEYYGDTDKQLLEWNGALRWHQNTGNLFETAEQYGGHAQRYPLNENQQHSDIFQPLQPGLLRIHQRLKQAFDPNRILNHGRIYTDL
jgi:glycolate oxidase FAD binding subunit